MPSVPGDYVLLVYLVFLIPLMLVGFGFARRKLFVPHHKLVMTTITIVNWVLISIVMLTTYRVGIEPKVPAELYKPRILIPTIHGIIGGVAQLLATYLVLRMWFENQLPAWIKVKNIKPYMRATLTMWLITALLGVGIWAIFYQERAASANSPLQPAKTQEATKSAATPGATEEATKVATPGATEESTKVATPGATASK